MSQFTINHRIARDNPKANVLAVEKTAEAICKKLGLDPAESVMMLLTAAAHMMQVHASPNTTPAQRLTSLATALGCASVAAESWFGKPAPENDNVHRRH